MMMGAKPGEISQIRFLLEDSDPQIVNKQIIINKKYFTDFVFFNIRKTFL